MSSPRRETGRTWPRLIRQILAVTAACAVGRALSHVAVDAFVLYVFGDPARELRDRSAAPRARQCSAGGESVGTPHPSTPDADRLRHRRCA
jgi:hypothetical protein